MNQENEVREGEVVDRPETALAIGMAEIDIQVSTAKRYPRNLTKFKRRALEMATLDADTAASCFYVIPRAGKSIDGPSARLAEIVVNAWGNMRSEARVTREDAKFVYAEAVTWDLETNTAIKIEVKRRITKKNGQRYDDDMIGVTSNAALSIALRNSVFKVVPMAYTQEIYQSVRKVAAGDIETLEQRRAQWFKFYKRYGITDEQILNTLDRESMDDVGLEDIVILQGINTALKDKEITIDAAFAPLNKKNYDYSKSKTENLADKINGSAPKEEKPPIESSGNATLNEDGETEQAVGEPDTDNPSATDEPKESIRDKTRRLLLEMYGGIEEDATEALYQISTFTPKSGPNKDKKVDGFIDIYDPKISDARIRTTYGKVKIAHQKWSEKVKSLGDTAPVD